MSKLDLSSVLAIIDASRGSVPELVGNSGKIQLTVFNENKPDTWNTWKVLYVRYAGLKGWNEIEAIDWIPFYLPNRLQKSMTTTINDLKKALLARQRRGRPLNIPSLPKVLATLDSKVYGQNYLRSAYLDFASLTAFPGESFRDFYDRVDSKRNDIELLPSRVAQTKVTKDKEMVDILVRGAPQQLRLIWCVKRPTTLSQALAEGEDFDSTYGDTLLSSIHLKNPDKMRLSTNQVLATSKILKGKSARDYLLKHQKETGGFIEHDDDTEETTDSEHDESAGDAKDKTKQTSTSSSSAGSQSARAKRLKKPPASTTSSSSSSTPTTLSSTSSPMLDFTPMYNNLMMAQMMNAQRNLLPTPSSTTAMVPYGNKRTRPEETKGGSLRKLEQSEIPSPEDNLCGNCGVVGHYARACTKPCRLCGDSSHNVRGCPNSIFRKPSTESTGVKSEKK